MVMNCCIGFVLPEPQVSEHLHAWHFISFSLAAYELYCSLIY